MKLNLLCLFFFIITTSYAQKNKISYEQKALNYFIEKVIPNKFQKVKYIIFNNKIDSDISENYCFCYSFIKQIRERNYKQKYPNKLVLDNYKVYKKINFFLKHLVSDKKIGEIFVLKHSLKIKMQAFVTIYFEYMGASYVYTFLIDEKNRKIIDYCFEKHIE